MSMIEQIRWFERKFNFDFPVGMHPVIVERIRSTAQRLREIVRGLSPEILKRRDGDKWSIQEQVGHLLDLDELHDGRIDDFLAGKNELRPADLKNMKTELAKHNEREINELLSSFEKNRSQFIARVEGLTEAEASRSALHPRLKQPMRFIDMLFFVAEHDDHHIALIRNLINRFS